jgi:hypothetical protein
MNVRRFRSQIVDHVLVILPDAIEIIKGLAVEGEPHAIRPVSDVEVLWSNATDDAARPDLDTLGLAGNQCVGVRRHYGDTTEHSCKSGPSPHVEQGSQLN